MWMLREHPEAELAPDFVLADALNDLYAGITQNERTRAVNTRMRIAHPSITWICRGRQSMSNRRVCARGRIRLECEVKHQPTTLCPLSRASRAAAISAWSSPGPSVWPSPRSSPRASTISQPTQGLSLSCHVPAPPLRSRAASTSRAPRGSHQDASLTSAAHSTSPPHSAASKPGRSSGTTPCGHVASSCTRDQRKDRRKCERTSREIRGEHGIKLLFQMDGRAAVLPDCAKRWKDPPERPSTFRVRRQGLAHPRRSGCQDISRSCEI